MNNDPNFNQEKKNIVFKKLCLDNQSDLIEEVAEHNFKVTKKSELLITHEESFGNSNEKAIEKAIDPLFYIQPSSKKKSTIKNILFAGDFETVKLPISFFESKKLNTEYFGELNKVNLVGDAKKWYIGILKNMEHHQILLIDYIIE